MHKVRQAIRKHRKLLSACAMVLAIALMFWAVNSPAIVGVSAAKRVLPIYSVQRDDRVVSLTFDAAWGNEDTQTLIDILGKYNVHATFFVVGEWVDKYPESVKALADAGNEVMNHSSTHPHMAQLSAEQIEAEVNTCAHKINAVTGTRPTLFRCPYGEYNDTVISAINALGMHAIQWDVDSLDWKGLSGDEITSRVLTRVQPGSIVLFHNAAEHTPEALAGIIEAKDIDPAALEVDPNEIDLVHASGAGRGFAQSGGVAKAVADKIKEWNPDMEVKIASAQGLAECKKLLMMAKAGKYNGYLLEGMGCPGGCIGGAGTIADPARTAIQLNKYVKEAPFTDPEQSPYMDEIHVLKDDPNFEI